MDLNSLAVEIIKSTYIKDCIAKENHKFTYEEQLAIILNSDEELSKKVSMLKLYAESVDVVKTLGTVYTSNINDIIDEMIKILEYVNGSVDNIILTYKTDTNLICAKQLDKLLDKIDIDTLEYYIEIDIHNIDTVEEIGCIIVDTDGKIVRYCLTNGVDSELYNQFINVPNDLQIGDIVSLVNNGSTYIVVSNPIMPSKFKTGLTYSDASVVVIPEYLLSSDKDYRKQIEEIYTDRINNIENPYAKPDIIMEYYTSINLLDVQK